MKIKNFYVSCENKNISNHIHIFIFSQKNRFQMTLKYKFCENKIFGFSQICENKILCENKNFCENIKYCEIYIS